MATQPPLPPPPLPPLPLDHIQNSELRLYPLDESNAWHKIHATLSGISQTAVVVGVLGDDIIPTTEFANRLLSRQVFSISKESSPFELRMFYDPEQKMIVLLGQLHPSLNGNQSSNVSQVLKQELLVHTSSHVLFIVHDHARISTAQTKHIRSLSSAKNQLLQLLKVQTKLNAKSGSNASYSISPFAPGRSVPLTTFVFPVPTEDVGRGNKSRASVMSFCKAMESRIHSILKPLRGGIVGTVRAKEASAPSNKERRLFAIDPSLCVIAVSRKIATSECNVADRMTAVLSSLKNISNVDLKQLLKPLDDDDTIGVRHAVQFAQRSVDLLLQEAHGKDPSTHLLSVGQWLRHFSNLVRLVVIDNGLFRDAEPSIGIPDETMTDFKESQLSLYQLIDSYDTFADDLCARESSIAVKRYQHEKPEKINTIMHQERIARTIAEFKRCVGNSNPLAEKYIQTIKSACDSVWENGRRLCDSTSLSNRPCSLHYHEDNSIVQHNSGLYLTVACACGHTMNRIADAFSIDTNRRELWVFPCCDRFEQYEIQSMPLIHLGLFDSYDPFQGFASVYQGFMPKYASLSPWFRTVESSDGASQPQRRKSKAKSKLNLPVPSIESTTSELIAYAGLEYECCMGHRFFFHTPVNQAPASSSIEEAIWPGCDMAIYVQCFQCAMKAQDSQQGADYAQLRRVYAAIPKHQKAIELNLLIKTEDQAHEVFSLQDYSLPEDSLICYPLPYVFSKGNGEAYRHGDALKLHGRVLVLSSQNK